MDAATKERLGQRWICFSCETKFYDLKKPEPLCPSCGTNQNDSPALEKKSTRRPRAKAKKKKAAKRAPRKKSTTSALAQDGDPDAPPPEDEGVTLGELELEGSEDLGAVQTDDDN